MKRLTHGAAVLLHAGGLRRGNAERVRQLLGVKTEQTAARSSGSNRAERAGEMPAAVMMTGRGLPDPHPGLEAGGVGGDQRATIDLAAIDPAPLSERKQRRQDRR